MHAAYSTLKVYDDDWLLAENEKKIIPPAKQQENHLILFVVIESSVFHLKPNWWTPPALLPEGLRVQLTGPRRFIGHNY